MRFLRVAHLSDFVLIAALVVQPFMSGAFGHLELVVLLVALAGVTWHASHSCDWCELRRPPDDDGPGLARRYAKILDLWHWCADRARLFLVCALVGAVVLAAFPVGRVIASLVAVAVVIVDLVHRNLQPWCCAGDDGDDGDGGDDGDPEPDPPHVVELVPPPVEEPEVQTVYLGGGLSGAVGRGFF